MAFGADISTLTRYTVGIYGYIVKINTASLLAYLITAVQAQASETSTPEPVTEDVSLDTLQGYVNSEDCPNLAFAIGDGECWVFFKTDGTDAETRSNTTDYVVGDVVKNSDSTKRFICVTGGQSGSSEPAVFSTADEDTGDITDGDVVWNYLDDIPISGGFPYSSTTRLALFGYRNAQGTTSDSDKLDLPDKDINLLKAYVLKDAYMMSKRGYVPKSVEDTIKTEEKRIREESL